MQRLRIADNAELEFHWFCEPSEWEIRGKEVFMVTDASTDFWQRSHYGFRRDNGHLLYTFLKKDFVMTATARFVPVNQYDQAGLMVRVSPSCWLKTSVEYECEEPAKLGAVVTNSGYSDWSTQDVPSNTRQITLKVERNGPVLRVFFKQDDWIQIRLAHMIEDDGKLPLMGGIYACSPKGKGFSAVFSDFSVITHK